VSALSLRAKHACQARRGGEAASGIPRPSALGRVRGTKTDPRRKRHRRRQLDMRSPKLPIVQHVSSTTARTCSGYGGILWSLQLTFGCCENCLRQTL
jgi:hypothetical protein